jgi:hypothetical protein
MPSLQLKEWRPLVKNTLCGFATVRLPNGLIIRDITIHNKDGRMWAGMPSKPLYSKDGSPFLQSNGKQRYAFILEWESRELSDGFGDALIALIKEEHPHALD